MTGEPPAAVRDARVALRTRAPRMAVLHGPASEEDRFYYASTPPDRTSSPDLRDALLRLGVTGVDLVDVTRRAGWVHALEGVDLVVVNLHGRPGEDGTVQGALRAVGVPFVGSDVEASVVALNKHLTKLVARDAGVATPRWFTRFSEPSLADDEPDASFDGHRVCKPLRGGSSLGLRRLGPGEPAPADDDWLVEEFLGGTDVTVTVVHQAGVPTALPAVALGHLGEVYDAEAKLGLRPGVRAVASRPVELVDALARCEAAAVRMHRAVGARHVSRSDFVMSDGEAYFLEINTLPGISAGSNCAECAYAAGWSYDDFIAVVVAPALPPRPGLSGRG